MSRKVSSTPAARGAPAERAPPRGGVAELTVRVHQGAGALDELMPEWLRLRARDPAATVFQTWVWCRHVWALDGAPDEALRVVTVHPDPGDSPGGSAPPRSHPSPRAVSSVGSRERESARGGPGGSAPPVGLGALAIGRAASGARVLRFVGHGLSDYHDLLIDGGVDPAPVVRAFGRFLAERSHEWDVIDLSELAPGARLLQHLGQGLQVAREAPVRVVPASEGRRLRLQGSDYSSYLQGLPRQLRREMARKRRRLDADFAARLDVEDGTGDPEESVETFLDLHERRHLALGQRGLFRSEAQRRGLVRLYRALFDAGCLRMVLVRLDGRVRAVDVSALHGGVLYGLNRGLDPDPAVARYSLGNLAVLRAIEMAYAEGATAVDFGRGAEGYKRHFAPLRPRSHRLLLTRRTLRGALHDLLARCSAVGRRLERAAAARRRPAGR